ncbi:hypothetical protein [Pelosinus sp. UFO1]|uniref:hypothetical protein n=1 Tax=Pelosinus sp. UFO1 TaxID=484770 RepID=UPI0004D13093|nr:hypothetical protein [Pelosinus sp. UFO1]AIF51854.1 hypothetical protein UFO1_2307 [Pelosinus sp. UFO1]
MNWFNIIRGLIVSLGNPVAFLAMIFSQIPGTIIGGHYFHISLFGLVALIAFGYLYLAVFALLKRGTGIHNDILGNFGRISTTMIPLSIVGLIVPVSCLQEMEENVFGFIVLPAVVIFALIWILVSLYAICKR